MSLFRKYPIFPLDKSDRGAKIQKRIREVSGMRDALPGCFVVRVFLGTRGMGLRLGFLILRRGATADPARGLSVVLALPGQHCYYA